jgi:hypothetical protein
MHASRRIGALAEPPIFEFGAVLKLLTCKSLESHHVKGSVDASFYNGT